MRWIRIVLSILWSLTAFAEQENLQHVGARVLVCFENASPIPSRVRALDETKKTAFPYLTYEELSKAVSIEPVVLYEIQSSLFRESLETVQEKKNYSSWVWVDSSSSLLNAYERSQGYALSLNKRYEEVFPGLYSKIEKKIKEFSPQQIRYRQNGVAAIEDQNWKGYFPHSECLLVPFSSFNKNTSTKLAKSKTPRQVQVDARILRMMQKLDPTHFDVIRNILFLNTYLSALESEMPEQDHLGFLTAAEEWTYGMVLKQKDQSIQEVYRRFREASFPFESDEKNKKKIFRFHFWTFIHDVLMSLYIKKDSVYKKNENEAVSLIHQRIPRMNECKTFGRKPHHGLENIYDCKTLLEKQLVFPLVEMNSKEKEEADFLLVELRGYEEQLIQKLTLEFSGKFEEKIRTYPLEKDFLKVTSLVEKIKSFIKSGSLKAVDYDLIQKSEEDLSFDWDEILFDLDSPLPAPKGLL